MRTDVLVIGAGVAGIATALALEGRSVAVVSEQALGRDLASAWAQGGIAAALGPDDAPALHAADTVNAGAGIVEEDAVDVLTREAPAAVAQLVRLGVPFDRAADGALALGLEAAHGRHRIAHAADATGAAILAGLLAEARRRHGIRLLDGLRAQRLMVRDDGRVTGAVFVAPNGETVAIAAHATVLATGGFGGLFARTTTPRGALGAGIAMAARAGATLADLEFVQFHPTALRSAGDPLPLVSEAVRGEGAVLVDDTGTRIMDGIDPRRELAPRDVVARAVVSAERAGRPVFLDARAAVGERFPQRFPGIFAAAQRAGIDPRVAPIPITVAAHYTIGGIATDLHGCTSVPGLWACGEVAATGLHGANRLASNSLVEGLVFGARVGRHIGGLRAAARPPAGVPIALEPRGSGDAGDALRTLRETMSSALGVVRTGDEMRRALDTLEAIGARASDGRVADAALVASAVAHAALARRESRGAHFRADFPVADDRQAQRSFVETAAQLARIS